MMMTKTIYKSTLVGGVLAALGATACCVLPLAFVTIGLGGAWLASLRALESVQGVFAAVTFACLGLAFYLIYVKPRRCAPGDACASPRVLKRHRFVFWVVVAAIVALGAAYAIIASQG